jgi:hypothetical protein
MRPVRPAPIGLPGGAAGTEDRAARRAPRRGDDVSTTAASEATTVEVASGHPALEARGFRVVVPIQAPRDAVWRALTDQDEIVRWFGWDYEGLRDEVRIIWADYATLLPPDRIDCGRQQSIQLIEDGLRTVVRIAQPGPLAGRPWDERYDEEIQGWHAFFAQLRHYLERHPGEERRTLYLAGTASAPEVLAAVDGAAPGRPWYAGRHQRVTAVEAYGGGLVVVMAQRGLDAAEPGRVQVILTTHGLDDARFAEARRAWAAAWSALDPDGSVTP